MPHGIWWRKILVTGPESGCMETSHSFGTIDTHTAGEPTRILTSGVNWNARGRSVREQQVAFEAEHDWIRRLLMQEPRGHADMFGAVPVEPAAVDADLGVIWLDHEGFPDQCGHGLIGIVTAFIETGQLSPDGPVRVETPPGVVVAQPTVVDGSVERVAVENVPSFVYDTVTVDVADLGPVEVDVVYSGIYVAIVDAAALGIPVDVARLDALREHGLAIRAAVNDTLDIEHPLTGERGAVRVTEFSERVDDGYRNTVVLADGSIDRSPCGTGTCAKATLLHAEGHLDVGETFTNESIIGTQFEGRILEIERRDGRTVTVPEVSGAAHVTGEHTFYLDPSDPTRGFSLTSGDA